MVVAGVCNDETALQTAHPVGPGSASYKCATISLEFEDNAPSFSYDGNILSERCLNRSKLLAQLVASGDGEPATLPLPFSIDTVKLWDSFPSASCNSEEMCQVLQVLPPGCFHANCPWFTRASRSYILHMF